MPAITVQDKTLISRFNDYKRKVSAREGKDLNNDRIVDLLLKEVKA